MVYFAIAERFLFLFGLDGKDESGSDSANSAKRECLMPDLCVICLEHEYNAVFVP